MMTNRILRRKITHKEARLWGTSHLGRFLRGECGSWWTVLDKEEITNRAALAHLSTAELDPEDKICWRLQVLIHKTDLLTPRELWHQHSYELTELGLTMHEHGTHAFTSRQDELHGRPKEERRLHKHEQIQVF